MGRFSLFFVIFFAFAAVSLGFEDDFEAQFEAETESAPKKEAALKVEEFLDDAIEENKVNEESKEEDFLDEFDDEEFVSSKKGSFSSSTPKQPTQQEQEQQKQQQQQQQAKQKAAAAAQARLDKKKLTQEELLVFFIPDFCVIGLMAAYVLFYFVGCHQNQSIANKFAEEYAPLFKDVFLYLGVDGRYFRRVDTIEKNTDVMARLSPTEYSILGTGHKNCAGMLLTLQLKSRQDFFSAVYNYFTKEKDDMMLEIPMNSLEMMNLLVVRKKDRDYYESTYGDLPADNEPIDCLEFPKDFCLVTDTDRAVLSSIFGNREVSATVKKYSGLIKSVHVTDQKRNSTHAKCLRFVFVMPEDVTQLKTLLKMSLYLVDFLAHYKHTNKIKQAVEFYRLKKDDGREKRQEKLAQKKEKEWSTLTEDQKKKRLEREKLRKMKKRAGQMKIMSM